MITADVIMETAARTVARDLRMIVATREAIGPT
jgi:hypothetical protein